MSLFKDDGTKQRIGSARILISILRYDIAATLGAGAKHTVRRLVGCRENDVCASVISSGRLLGLCSILGIVQIGDSKFGWIHEASSQTKPSDCRLKLKVLYERIAPNLLTGNHACKHSSNESTLLLLQVDGNDVARHRERGRHSEPSLREVLRDFEAASMNVAQWSKTRLYPRDA
jgi:hypothetical protein